MNKLKGTEANSCANVDTVSSVFGCCDLVLSLLQVLFQQVRQMWLSRGACVKIMNRQKDVNASVRMYQRSDSEFAEAMKAFKEESKALGVNAGFDFISGFMSLQTICYMEV